MLETAFAEPVLVLVAPGAIRTLLGLNDVLGSPVHSKKWIGRKRRSKLLGFTGPTVHSYDVGAGFAARSYNAESQ